MTVEKIRLEQALRREKHWKRWGPYLSERQWGTVREDYSADGEAWYFFPFEHSHVRAYRWGEDGLCGISDNHQRLCFALALWNGKDPILKERLYGLNNGQGNHGEDVKEVYYYLDSTPTHSYMKCLYKYPQAPYPYTELVNENSRRGLDDAEFELWDTGVFDESRYWDVFVEYAKADVNDILVRITIHNRGPETATLHLMPTLWFRNRWAWGRKNRPQPWMKRTSENWVTLHERQLGNWQFWMSGSPEMLFTHNDTNPRLWQKPQPGYFKDAFHDRIIAGQTSAVSPDFTGTKMCGWYQLTLEPGKRKVIRCRLSESNEDQPLSPEFEETFSARAFEADEFYRELQGCGFPLSEAGRSIHRQALAGLLWNKQYYHYVVEDWITGDPSQPRPPEAHKHKRNAQWKHFFSEDIISMPDKWEYPWFAAWDLAFHTLPLALVDGEFAKQQLQLFLREWFLHPNGQLPAYEWNFEDVNPPVHAWAVWRVFKIDAKQTGKPDYAFLEGAFHKLLMNFTWWVNRKDSVGDNIFEGGFLGLDNIGVFDRSKPLPTGGLLEQADGTSWMAMYSLNMLRIAVELAQINPVYEDTASKFLEHFLYISYSMNRVGGVGLWDETDGFYYDRLRLPDGRTTPMRVRSLVGLIPLFAVETLDGDMIQRLEGFERRTRWFMEHRPELCPNLILPTRGDASSRGILALMDRTQLEHMLRVLLDESEFLSPFGIRSMSRTLEQQPFLFPVNGSNHRVDYEPGESRSRLFGGNSNWRGPIWFPTTYLIIESLQKYAHYYGDSFRVECPVGSGTMLTLDQAAAEISRRLARLFLPDETGQRPCFGDTPLCGRDPNFSQYLWFHEYFHAETGKGLGANHQTGWTALVAKLLMQSGE